MPRLRRVTKSEATAPIVTTVYEFPFEGPYPVAEPGTFTGAPGDWWTVFALVPDVLDHAVKGFGLYQSPKRILDPALRESGQIRAGWAAGSQFVFSQHAKSMRDMGMPEEEITFIPAWTVADCCDATERACWPTPTASSTPTGASLTSVSPNCAAASPTRRSSSSPTSPRSTSNTPSCHARCAPSSTTETIPSPKYPGPAGVGHACWVHAISGDGRVGRLHLMTAAHVVSPDDERRHQPGPEDLWSESYCADFVHEDGTLGGWLGLGLYPNRQVAWWTTWIVGPDRPGVCSVIYHVPVPAGDGLVAEDAAMRIELELLHPLRQFRIAASAPAEVFDHPEDV